MRNYLKMIYVRVDLQKPHAVSAHVDLKRKINEQVSKGKAI